MGVRLDPRPRVAGRRSVAPERISTAVACQVTGATTRQVNYWAGRGLLGAHLEDLGSGRPRSYAPEDLEVLWALAELARLGCADEWMGRAADAVRARRVVPAGEQLIVELEGGVRRVQAGASSVFTGPAWVVFLRAFGAVG